MKGWTVISGAKVFYGLVVLCCIWSFLGGFVLAAEYPSLHAAAEAGDIEAISAMLDQGNDVNLRDNRGYTPVIAAAAGGHAKAVGLLLQRGADLNAVDNAGNTALHVGAAYGQVDVCRLLLQNGARVDARNYAGLSPLDIARSAQRAELIALFEAASPGAEGQQAVQDPNQVWREEAMKVLRDPNALASRLGANKDLYDAITSLGTAARQEIMAWVQPSRTQATRLQRAIQTQITAELEFIRKVAGQEGAKATVADVNQLIAAWDQRLKMVSDRLREQRRQEMAQMRGRPTSTRRAAVPETPIPLPPVLPQPVPIAAPGPNVATPKGYFDPARIAADGRRLAEAWVGSDVQQLASEVNDVAMRDLGYLRTVAGKERVTERLLTAIDAVMVMRAKRYSVIAQYRQGGQMVEPQQTGEGGWRRQGP
ncbi:MAG: ankyrin repeat domain-containing protein [Sedimentisphaerales bacterium]|jgi:hypothetical protein|nr:ankyrin repeat domain-containing protein [Sedimentisphaerales bacterium]